MHIRVHIAVPDATEPRTRVSLTLARTRDEAELAPPPRRLCAPVLVELQTLVPPAGSHAPLAPAQRGAAAPHSPLALARHGVAATLTRPLAALDLETTGLDVQQARIVQIGVAILFPDGHIAQWQSLVQPWPPVIIPAATTAVHGIDGPRLLAAAAPRLAQLADGLLEQLRDCDLLGHNFLAFDLPLLANELACLGHQLSPASHRLDSQRLYGAHAAEAGWPGGSSLAAAIDCLCGREQAAPHDALADALDSLDVFCALTAQTPAPRPSIAQLAARCAELPPRHPPACEPEPALDVDFWRAAAVQRARLTLSVRLDGRSLSYDADFANLTEPGHPVTYRLLALAFQDLNNRAAAGNLDTGSAA